MMPAGILYNNKVRERERTECGIDMQARGERHATQRQTGTDSGRQRRQRHKETGRGRGRQGRQGQAVADWGS
jgi:hypothetical protein